MGQHKFAARTGLNGEPRRDGKPALVISASRAFAAQLVFHLPLPSARPSPKKKYPGGRLSTNVRSNCFIILCSHRAGREQNQVVRIGRHGRGGLIWL